MKSKKRPQVAGGRNPVAVAARGVYRRGVVPDKRGQAAARLAKRELRGSSHQSSVLVRTALVAAATV